MKKITIEISKADGSDISGKEIAWELISLANILAMPAYKDDHSPVANRMAWYTIEDPENVVKVNLS